jgi:hypothetical protein
MKYHQWPGSWATSITNYVVIMEMRMQGMRNGGVDDKSPVGPSYVAISGAVLSILSLVVSLYQ